MLDITIESDTKLLEQLIKNLDNAIDVKVGVFGDSGLAEVAAKLEFGAVDEFVPQLGRTVDIPPRSFLYAPIENNLEKEMKGQIKEEDVLNKFENIAQKIGITSKDIVDAYFQNEGYGTWAPNDPEWREYKETHGYHSGILHYTNKLRDNIEYKVGG